MLFCCMFGEDLKREQTWLVLRVWQNKTKNYFAVWLVGDLQSISQEKWGAKVQSKFGDSMTIGLSPTNN